MRNIVIANAVGKLEDGRHVVLFPSRWDCALTYKPFCYYPYELAYLSSLLKRRLDDDIHYVDGNRHEYDVAAYVAALQHIRPLDVFITECSALTYPSMCRVRTLLKPKNAILCGPHGAAFPERAEQDGWTRVVSGEYEDKVLAILKGWPRPMGLVDLDTLPWPEDKAIPRSLYSECSNPLHHMIQVYPTRGCNLNCSFCACPTYYKNQNNERPHRCRNARNVCEELEYLKDRYPHMTGAFFNEEVHNANLPWLREFANLLIAESVNLRYDAMCGYWNLDEDTVSLLAEAGYIQLRFGIETLDEEAGKKLGKRVSRDRLASVLRWCRSSGIRTYGTFMVGAPGSTLESDMRTADAVLALRGEGLLNKWQVSICTPQPGTRFYKEAESYLMHHDYTLYDGRSAVVSWPHYPAAKVTEAYRRFCKG